MDDPKQGTTVAVTSKGQATIPKAFRERLDIDAPGRVRFVENEAGEVVVRPVERPAELRGGLAGAETGDRTATELLRESRDDDSEAAAEKYGSSKPAE